MLATPGDKEEKKKFPLWDICNGIVVYANILLLKINIYVAFKMIVKETFILCLLLSTIVFKYCIYANLLSIDKSETAKKRLVN